MTTHDDGPFAHTADGVPPSAWEPLEDHLHKVADMAASFAGAFDATECGRLTGLWHDLGKYAPDWQQFLLAAAPSPARARAWIETAPIRPAGTRRLSSAAVPSVR